MAGRSWLEMDGTGMRQLTDASPQVLLPKPCCLHPILLVNMIAFEGIWFATEAMLSRLLNLHIPALRRALENGETWKEFGRGGEKTCGKMSSVEPGMWNRTGMSCSRGRNLKGYPVEGAQLHLSPQKELADFALELPEFGKDKEMV